MEETQDFQRICFRHPEPVRRRPRILPIFMPNAGCPHRCLFCNQEEVTGHQGMAGLPKGAEDRKGKSFSGALARKASVGARLGAEQGAGQGLAHQADRTSGLAASEECLRLALEQLPDRFSRITPQAPVAAAFYGGTFTALQSPWPLRFLKALEPLRHSGLVSAVRCSTRPDAVEAGQLLQLAAAGLDTVELGVQTFDEAVLAGARRGHGASASLEACRRVRAAGLGLGLQLLPGLPGHTLQAFDQDIDRCIALRPDFVRIHPCLVLSGTGLETLWRRGDFAPWELAATLEALGKAVSQFWSAGIPVARVGLAPEASLLPAILAGPWHPALGARARARALWHDIRRRLNGRLAASLSLPQRSSGEFWGHAGEMEPEYRALGLVRSAVTFTEGDEWMLEVRDA